MANSTADREIVVNRVIDAPRELVFEAFTEPEHIKEWWAPRGSTTHEMDVQPGSAWSYSQRIRGSEQRFKIEFIEISKPERLVYDYGPDSADASDPVRTTVTFDQENGKTKVTLQLLFATAKEREQAVKYGAIVGAMQSLEELADYVAKI
jgi:uncharacterized protein YndB with AHSA1/START domain